MPTDLNAIVENLTTIYDFSGKTVIHVGAGGGQILPFTDQVRSVIGVDPDPKACALLRDALRGTDLAHRFQVMQSKFSEFSGSADVVFFEFCLHEMDDPKSELDHAKSVAADIVVLDHAPDSDWAWHTCETEKAEKSWAAVRHLMIQKMATFHAPQCFETYDQLHEYLKVLGDEAIARIGRFSGQRGITIDMAYSAAFLR